MTIYDYSEEGARVSTSHIRYSVIYDSSVSLFSERCFFCVRKAVPVERYLLKASHMRYREGGG